MWLGNAVTSSTLHADPPSNETIDIFYIKRDCNEDISTYVVALHKLFVDLNDELAKHNKNTLSERMLTGRILTTFSKGYDNFTMYGIPSLQTNRRWIGIVRSSARLRFELTHWHRLKLRRSLYVTMTRWSRIPRSSVLVNLRKEEPNAQNRNFLATSARLQCPEK